VYELRRTHAVREDESSLAAPPVDRDLATALKPQERGLLGQRIMLGLARSDLPLDTQERPIRQSLDE
jgi:hypothetical protein